MSLGKIETFTMYDIQGHFIPPDDTETYDWPSNKIDENGNKIVDDWNTWARALVYWFRDKLGFDFSSGDGSTMGKIGRMNWYRSTYSDSANAYPINVESYYWDNQNNRHYQLPTNYRNLNDNDWSNSDYGLYDLQNEDWDLYRAPSPFRPQQINGNNYYTDGTEENGELKWTGKWLGIEIFDDVNNRFDINIKINNFDNLGFRIKYPLTATSTRACKGYMYPAWKSGDAPNDKYYYSHQNQDTASIICITPCVSLIKNNKQLAILERASLNSQSDWSLRGFISTIVKYSDYYIIFLTENFCNSQLTQTSTSWDSLDSNTYDKYKVAIKKDGTKIQKGTVVSSINSDIHYRSKKTSSSDSGDYDLYNHHSIEPHGWTPETLEDLNTFSKGCLFGTTGKDYRYIKYIKSYDNNVFYITLCTQNNAKGIELLFYKNEDNTSGCLMSEGQTQTRNSNISWVDSGGTKHWYTDNTTHPYGNIGGLEVTSSEDTSFPHYVVTPQKYYYDIRDTSKSLIDETGLWRLERYCPRVNTNTYASSLYLVTRCGTKDKIGPEGKFITCTINNKKIKFVIFPFNSSYLGENNFNDTSTLFAIPIEKED